MTQPAPFLRSARTRCVLAGVLLALLSPGSAAPGWAFDEAPGTAHTILPADMPGPSNESAPFNPPRIVPRRPTDVPQVPAGFIVTPFAEGLAHPYSLSLAPNGDVLVAEPDAGQVTVLRDRDGDGTAEMRAIFARGLSKPLGVVALGRQVYVADQLAVWRFDRGTDGRAEGRVPVSARGALGAPTGNWTRPLIYDPRTDHFYVGVGSRRNLGFEPLPRASIQRLARDGSAQETYASGLRDPTGLAFHPETGELYAVVSERDGLGDELVPDFFSAIMKGDFFGWPVSYIGDNPQPGDIPGDSATAAPAPDNARMPDLLIRAHSEPSALVFYTGAMFPPDWQGDALIALRGSWSAAVPRGYKVIRVPFEDGRPAGGYETFVTGFWIAGRERATIWGRPAGLAVARDGALLIADDTAGIVWRIAHDGAEAP